MNASRSADDDATPELPDGGWSNTEKGWVLHPSQEARNRAEVAAALAEIDRRQAHYPVCGLPGCGQRTIQLDKFGLCTKVSESHASIRRAERAVFR